MVYDRLEGEHHYIDVYRYLKTAYEVNPSDDLRAPLVTVTNAVVEIITIIFGSLSSGDLVESSNILPGSICCNLHIV